MYKFSEIDLVDPLSIESFRQDVICSLCEKFMLEPMELACCGAYLCKSCLDSSLANGGFSCFECQQVNNSAFLSIRAKKRVMQVQGVKCHQTDCSVVGTLEYILNQHLKECPCVLEPCGLCNQLVRRDRVQQHENEECNFTVKCPHRAWSNCQWTGTLRAQKYHLAEDPNHEKHMGSAEDFVGQLKNQIECASSRATVKQDSLKLIQQSEQEAKAHTARLSEKIRELQETVDKQKQEITDQKKEIQALNKRKTQQDTTAYERLIKELHNQTNNSSNNRNRDDSIFNS